MAPPTSIFKIGRPTQCTMGTAIKSYNNCGALRTIGLSKSTSLLHCVDKSSNRGVLKLESNSGHVEKVCIKKVQGEENPYPKSYTCFHRLELPAYECKQVLEESLEFIIKYSCVKL